MITWQSVWKVSWGFISLVITWIRTDKIMVEDGGGDVLVDSHSAEEWLLRAQELVPVALEKAREVKGFPGRWKMIISKLEQIPSRLSNLSSHPCFSKNALCKEQLQAVLKTLNEAIELAELCVKEKYKGKLRMQSDLDALTGKLDLNLRDCGLLIKTGVLGEVTLPSSAAASSSAEPEAGTHSNIRELLARLQIGHLEAKHKALDSLVELMKEDEKNALAVLGRSNIASLVQLLTATSPRIREKTVTVICSLAESGSCENWLVSEGVLPPLIRLVESGSAVGKEKATISLQRLSMSTETARSIVGHGGVRPLIEICRTGDSVSQAAAACTLKNISAVPDVRLTLSEEGIIKVMVNLLDCGILLGSKEYAAECLQNLTSSNDNLRRSVISEGGIRSLLTYLDGPLPQESAVGALRNLVGSVSIDVLVSLGLLPRLVHVLRSGSLGAQQAAASAICRLCSSAEMKKSVCEAGCIPLLRVCTVLYQQQNSPEPKLRAHLSRCDFDLTHEFFLQVCNKFPYSWRPVYNFFQFTETQPHFEHTSITFNKMVDVIGKSRNIDLFWEVLHEMGRRGVVTDKTYRIALKTLASARELKKCTEFFHLMNGYGCSYSLETLNKVVETLCKSKLVVEAQYVVTKMKDWIKPTGVTYKYLISGFCDVGDLIEASKIWNLMVDEGFELEIDLVEEMMETLFKTNQFDEAMKLFQMMRTKRIDDLGLSTYRLVIDWMCQKGKLGQAHLVFEEMQKRGIRADNTTMASLIYGLLTKCRIREAYRIMEGIEKPDITVYHEMIKGLLRLRRSSEATQVFREMIKRGCEPIMHTYIMLLQGHLGKRGRKGSDPLVNFDTIFVGGLVKAGKSLEATKYVERAMNRGLEVPRFDYNRFLHYYSNEEGVVMFEVMAKKLREVGLFDLADIFARYGEKMATRERRRNRATEP